MPTTVSSRSPEALLCKTTLMMDMRNHIYLYLYIYSIYYKYSDFIITMFIKEIKKDTRTQI